MERLLRAGGSRSRSLLRRRVQFVVTVLVWACLMLGASGTIIPLLSNGPLFEGLRWLIATLFAAGVLLALLIGELIVNAIIGPTQAALDALDGATEPSEALLRRAEALDEEVGGTLSTLVRLWGHDRDRQEGKIAFVASLIHDLKTTLTGLSLLHHAGRPASTASTQRSVEPEVVATRRWLTRALDALRLDQLDQLLDKQACQVEAVCNDVAHSLRREAPANVTIAVEGSASANVDPAEFRRAMVNLLSNAVRVARTQVVVEVFPGLIRISDDGPGLPGSLEVLSEPFEKVDVGTNLTTSGTGLGLFIARRILELHGGKLVCERSSSSGTTLLAYYGSGR